MMITRILALTSALWLVAPATAAVGPDPVQVLQTQVAAARTTLVRHYKEIDARSGFAAALQTRLDNFTSILDRKNKPDWESDENFLQNNAMLVKLDSSLIEQLASGNYHDMSAIRGADDTVFKAPADGTLQPVGVYVPPSYDPHKPASVVVFLHGRTWTENYIIANPWVRAAADASGSIVIAPYCRGDSQYVDPAPSDAYAALDVARKAFNTDGQRTYLAGHSMGGYGVFIVGPRHPEVWAAVLAASGGLTTPTLNAALHALRRIPVYLVVGSDDQIVPKGYMKKNADLLRGSGIETHFYEEAGGLHNIGSISNAFAHAWRDMLTRTQARSAEVVPAPTPPPLQLPTPRPLPTLHA